ncbi:tRNA pseudouridine(55) synthase TruB [Cognatilysobacter bugurensis]|uniref:tRNA pseudouridine synthase B n=1 Tax=Cognatilysobacter bugurensis TaxID=543356 RepID=A0A918SUD1_9GAMM|nr:tRNA pseudouridine(55) synthase TruB [Lysobacter bugurensis]GHA71226.1 tRNA pseudouridine synthase B [Lysobacter bugurensis]
MSPKPRIIFRQLDGLLLLDKPAGLSSNQALQQVRRLFRAEKGGHTGSLDPLATGLLPLCFGEATKIAGLLLGSYKAYETVAVLGVTTDTDDADGVPLRERAVPDIDDAAIESALAHFRGALRQRAPVYSALKQGGEPLYAKARRGETIEAPVRDVQVQRFELIERNGNRLRLHVECGSGTYVRSLVRDLGETLGCGAHVAVLRRTWVEPFRAPRMFTLDALHALAMEGDDALLACLLPIEAGLESFPRAVLSDESRRGFAHGQTVPFDAAGLRTEGTIAVFDADGRCLGLAEQRGASLAPQRVFRAAWNG